MQLVVDVVVQVVVVEEHIQVLVDVTFVRHAVVHDVVDVVKH